MKSLSEGKKKYLFLIPIVFLLMNAYYFQHVSEQIHDTILSEKRREVDNNIKMLAAVANQDEGRPQIDHEPNIVKAVEYLNSLPMTFAGVYKRVNGSLTMISKRNEEIMFNPIRYSEFFDKIAKNESGYLELPYMENGKAKENWHLYFQFIPQYAPLENRFLVVTAIADRSVVNRIPLLESAGQWGSTVLTFLLNVILVVKITKKRQTAEGRKV